MSQQSVSNVSVTRLWLWLAVWLMESGGLGERPAVTVTLADNTSLQK